MTQSSPPHTNVQEISMTTTPALSKTSQVMQHDCPHPGTRMHDVQLTHTFLATGTVEHDWVPSDDREVLLDSRTWEDLGSPETITVTIQPGDTLNPTNVCPECVQGKHLNCAGQALNPATDELVACDCYHVGSTK